MKIFKKVSIIVLAVAFMFGLAGLKAVNAATTPSLGTLSPYAIVSSTYTNSLNTPPETLINGDRCDTTPPGTPPTTTNGTITTGGCLAQTGLDQTTLLANLNAQVTLSCNSLGVNITLDNAPGHVTGVYTPGCYSSTGTMDIALSTTVTLDGPGTYIFKSGGAITTGANSKVILINGASASDVFWLPTGGAISIGANAATSATPTFVGTIIADALVAGGINLGHFVNLLGRTLAFGHTVTTNSVTITVPTTLTLSKVVTNDNGGIAVNTAWTLSTTAGPTIISGATGSATVTNATVTPGVYTLSESGGPAGYTASTYSCVKNGGGAVVSNSITLAAGDNVTCTITNDDIAPSGGGGVSRQGTINVVKVVINDNGGTKKIADFPLFVNNMPVVSGQSNSFSALVPDVYTVTETSDSNYTRTFSGDCDINGRVGLNPGDSKYCIITNNDIGAPAVVPPVPPLIDVVKVPNPLALPLGPGPVTYTYTLKNIGIVPVADITLVGDTCSPIVLISGDTNNDAKLDLAETWVHTCTANLTATHTNTVVATGWANGISATDIASATVVVGTPLVPPIIHITKTPNPLRLFSLGGMVTYTKRVTNPGTAPLSNVQVTDDKCAPINYISGDVNGDAKLDPSETWIYTCRTRVTRTTTNTAVATGEANGWTARDFAVATVVVATSAPRLPKTGFPPATLGEKVRAITANLGVGSRDDNVRTLQQFLISESKGPKAVALSTHGTTPNFSTLTKEALVEWQKAVGVTPASGSFGPKTQAYLSAN